MTDADIRIFCSLSGRAGDDGPMVRDDHAGLNVNYQALHSYQSSRDVSTFSPGSVNAWLHDVQT